MINLKKKRLSDEEYVEKLRRNILRSRRWGIIFSGFYIVAFFALLMLFQQLLNSFSRERSVPFFSPGLKMGIALGFSMGAMLFSLIKLLVDSVMMASGHFFSRMPILLIKYYDLAHSGKMEEQTGPSGRVPKGSPV